MITDLKYVLLYGLNVPWNRHISSTKRLWLAAL